MVLAAVALVAAACGALGAPSAATPSLPDPATGSTAAAPSEPTLASAQPSDRSAPPSTQVSDLFQPFDDVTFRSVDEATLADFSAALGASVEGAGTLGDVRLAEAMRGDEAPVLTAAFTLVPAEASDEQTMFALLTADLAASLGADWEDALDGQGLQLETPAQTMVVLPWGTLPDGAVVFLLVSGSEAAAVERVAAGLAE